jgi:hypothetical protein
VTTAPVASGRRFTRARPCPICGGHSQLARHRGIRCWGFLGYEGLFAHCERDQTEFWHRIAGPCRCGRTHGNAPAPVPAERTDDARDRTRYALRLWDRAVPASGTATEAYLRSRGIEGPLPPTLRHLEAHPHKMSATAWPVMLARVELVGRPGLVGVHRTYLAPDGSGKAPVEPAKMMLGEFGRGEAVRLAPAASTMAVAEGIETALSVTALSGMPCWAGLSDGGVARLVLPPLPLAVDILIAADGDSAGRKAAFKAAERWRSEGRVVRVKEAPAGEDFNDVLLRGLA